MVAIDKVQYNFDGLALDARERELTTDDPSEKEDHARDRVHYSACAVAINKFGKTAFLAESAEHVLHLAAHMAETLGRNPYAGKAIAYAVAAVRNAKATR